MALSLMFFLLRNFKLRSNQVVLINPSLFLSEMIFFFILVEFGCFVQAGDEEFDDNPIEEVRLTVPITDDPTQPVLTFRTWVLGIASCCILAFLNRFFGFRQNQLSIGSVSAQIIVLPIGKLMAATLPRTPIRIPLTPWSFSLNPGPFTLKEHVLITIFASCGAGGVYAVHIITIVKAFYHRQLNPVAALLLAQTTQVIGRIMSFVCQLTE